VLINIRVSAETRTPIALVQLPLGINMPRCQNQVDDGKRPSADPDHARRAACYANLTDLPDVLAALKSGQQLKISFQKHGEGRRSDSMPLADFATGDEKNQVGLLVTARSEATKQSIAPPSMSME